MKRHLKTAGGMLFRGRVLPEPRQLQCFVGRGLGLRPSPGGSFIQLPFGHTENQIGCGQWGFFIKILHCSGTGVGDVLVWGFIFFFLFSFFFFH